LEAQVLQKRTYPTMQPEIQCINLLYKMQHDRTALFVEAMNTGAGR